MLCNDGGQVVRNAYGFPDCLPASPARDEELYCACDGIHRYNLHAVLIVFKIIAIIAIEKIILSIFYPPAMVTGVVSVTVGDGFFLTRKRVITLLFFAFNIRKNTVTDCHLSPPHIGIFEYKSASNFSFSVSLCGGST